VSLTIGVRGRPISRLDRWNEAQHAWWWFDESYLGHSLTRISGYFELLEAYMELPKELGHVELAEWATDHGISAAYAHAREDLDQILAHWDA
jgi:hypothetical protein